MRGRLDLAKRRHLIDVRRQDLRHFVEQPRSLQEIEAWAHSAGLTAVELAELLHELAWEAPQ